MDNQLLEILVCQSVGIVKEAGAFIRSHVGKVHKKDIIEKEKHSLVSFVDIEAEKLLIQKLSPLLPEAKFLTEEGTFLHTATSSSYRWIIDPLDGTTNFLKGIPVFSISLALEEDHQLLIGIVYDVMRDECFYAWKDGGSYVNGERIQVSSIANLEESVLAAGFPYARKSMSQLASLFIKVLEKARGVRRLGSAALDLAYVACGRFDGYYETRLNSWDVAAGVLLVQEAGGKVANFLDSKFDWIHDHHIIASNGHIQNELHSICTTLPLD